MSLNNISTQKEKTDKKTAKIIIVYYSYGGNTRTAAGIIQKMTGGVMFELEPLKPYPADYDELVDQGQKEVRSKYKPTLKNKVGNISSYDIVFLGFPIWWYTIPSAMLSFLSEYNLSGKTVIPFCTHGGYGKGHSFEAVGQLCSESVIQKGLSLNGTKVKDAQPEIAAWLKQINIVQ